ncbi:PqqD family protein [Sphingorhabdus sp. Alg239-R122]|uniref:PqqD family protein n=1 Tax=Sphingorhabdus sp. Alg239-R122 TaxID=2305989 RepID=UPI0013DA5B76|nr:PqqD family protein [Sphingorhabdus sp. Alg239-R122]
MSEIKSDSSIRKNENFVETTVDGEVVLMHLDDGRFFSLSDTGKRIWELLDSHDHFDELVTATLREYDVSQEKCRQDLVDLLHNLKERALITIA